jgi:hypothetical protein
MILSHSSERPSIQVSLNRLEVAEISSAPKNKVVRLSPRQDTGHCCATAVRSEQVGRISLPDRIEESELPQHNAAQYTGPDYAKQFWQNFRSAQELG